MKEIVCFFLTPTPEADVSLRRYTLHPEGGACNGYHNVSTAALYRVPFPLDNNLHGWARLSDDRAPRTDPRWPTLCACGYVFKDDDQWQVNTQRLFKRSDTGELTTLREAPLGAMWDASYLDEKGPDGMSLTVRTPGGDWHVDKPMRGEAAAWTRTGTPPYITARPSIFFIEKPSYHGWLTNGVLREC